MKRAIILYLHVHQPYRLRHYTIYDAGINHQYYDSSEGNTDNSAILRKVAEKSYIPTNQKLLQMLHDFPEFKLSLSITGTVLDQMAQWEPGVLDSFKELVNTGRV